MDEKVVPIIGANAILCSETESVGKNILGHFKNLMIQNGIENLNDYDECLYNYDIKLDEVHEIYYDAVNEITTDEKHKQNIITHSKPLIDFLKIKKFPIIIYCSPDIQINTILNEVWKDRAQHGLYNPNSYEKNLNMSTRIWVCNEYIRSSNTNIQDYDKSKNITTPYVVHLFGRADQSLEDERIFAITEDDKLCYIRKLLDPRNFPVGLSRALAGKIFLFIGCDIPEWLFTFLYHVLRQEASALNNNNFLKNYKQPLIEAENTTINLRGFNHFLREFNMELYRENCYDFLSKLTTTYHQVYNSENQTYGKPPKIDVFISYCWEDRSIAVALETALSKKGIEVWLDKKSNSYTERNQIKQGQDFDKAIKNAIKETAFFIPIISNNIENADKDRYVFKEWTFAIENDKIKLEQHPDFRYIVPCYANTTKKFIIKDPELQKNFTDCINKAHNYQETDQISNERLKEEQDFFENLTLPNEAKEQLTKSFIGICDMVKTAL